jgi:CheY-like chemotaxis protein
MLTAINGYSDMTLRRMAQDNPLRGNIEEIRSAGDRSAALTHQLLAFSRQQILQPVVLNINDVVTDTIEILHRLIGEDIQLNTVLNQKVGRVKVDPGQFSQIVMNLAINARDAMPRGGKLTIETANVFLKPDYTDNHQGILPGDYVMLAVSDSGAGISDEDRKHIFEPFFTTKEVGKGTGLGLATVYGIVKQSGGSIEVESEKGVGTTFKIYVPLVTDILTAGKTLDTHAAMQKGTETILLVEDEEVVRNLARKILITCGYKVLEAENGVEALSMCETGDFKFDLLMTDVVMPVMGGRELAEILTLKFPNLKILFTSGYTDDAVVRQGVIATNTNFIQKPYTPEAMSNKVRQVLNNHSIVL